MGKIKKILENELVGGTQTNDIYPVTSIKAIYNENNERLDNILKNLNDKIGNLVDLTSEQNITATKTFSGGISMNNTKILNVAAPTANDDAANKEYVDNKIADIPVEKGSGYQSMVQIGNGNASAYNSSAFGLSTASGDYSHSEGYRTKAAGASSHAEGDNATASGNQSHAEGRETQASGDNSHAEGYQTKALQFHSHAEGFGTEAKNYSEHAEGSFNVSHEHPTLPSKRTVHSVGIGTSDTDRRNAMEIMKNGDVYVLGIGGYDGTNLETVKTVQEVAEEVVNAVQIKYTDLKSLRDAGKLVPGQQYRITDYTCTTTQANTKSAGHQFDIIVTADDESTLNEEARAIKHEGDAYFANSKLSAWRLWYCLDNDTTRFAWADKTNGKGVIYRMIDEFNNDCPYDFKNIQFERYKITQCPKCKTLVGKYAAKESNKYEINKSQSIWAYTFTHIDDAGHILDHSIVGATMPNNKSYYVGVYNNKISSVLSYLYPGSDKPAQFQYRLNNICFISDSVTSKGFSYGCYSNVFESNCHSMTFGTSCNSNAFGEYCYENTFGDAIWFQSIGKECNNNIFGNGHKYNTLGGSCSNNIFGTNYKYNTLGYNCYNNEFGDNYFHNSFGISNYALKLGNDLQSNTFLNYCSYIVFGSDTSATEKYAYYKTNFFGNNCKYILFKGTESSGDPESPFYIQNYNLAQGLQGTSSAYLTIDGKRSRAYETKVAKNFNGELKVYCEADLIK